MSRIDGNTAALHRQEALDDQAFNRIVQLQQTAEPNDEDIAQARDYMMGLNGSDAWLEIMDSPIDPDVDFVGWAMGILKFYRDERKRINETAEDVAKTRVATEYDSYRDNFERDDPLRGVEL